MQTIASIQATDRAERAAVFNIPTPRAKAREYYGKHAQAQTETRVANWAQDNPAAYEWIVNNSDTNTFAGSLHSSLHRYGSLTDRQLLAVLGAIARATIAKTKAENAPSLSLEPIEVAFRKAQDAGIARPKLRLGEFTFSPAPMTGKNPGAIYVNGSEGTYLGKVSGGRLFTVAHVSPEVEQEIVAVASDPLNSAIAYGKRYGKCSVCARTLTDEESINRGIGPVCAERFGW